MFEQLLLQATVTESLTALIIAVTGIIGVGTTLFVTILKMRAQGRTLTDTEKKLIQSAEFTQLGAQKTKENIGQISAFMKAVYDSLPEEAKQKAKINLQPLLDTSTERIQTTEEQIALFAKILGINVDMNAEVPRESKATLERINEAIMKVKLRDV